TAAALDALSAILAIVAATLLARLIDAYAKATEQRMSDLEYFAGRVAHDIRSPLAAVSLALDKAQRKSPLDVSIRPMLEHATRSLQRVSQLVEGLLVLARAGMRPDEGARSNLRTIAKDVVDGSAVSAQAHGIDLVIEPFEAVEIAANSGVLTS